MNNMPSTILPVVVHFTNKGVDIHIPDFKITQHGVNFMTAMADAIQCVNALRDYYLSRNIDYNFTTTMDDVQKECRGKDFATCIIFNKGDI